MLMTSAGFGLMIASIGDPSAKAGMRIKKLFPSHSVFLRDLMNRSMSQTLVILTWTGTAGATLKQ